jgi:antitoxin (DNA-binding transcriptional repressor) of toxin-antitoxin stability system
MVNTMEANTPELRALVDRTRQGEEVLLTLDGKAESRVMPAAEERPPIGRADMEWMARELAAHLDDGVTGVPGTPVQEILDELRAERL